MVTLSDPTSTAGLFTTASDVGGRSVRSSEPCLRYTLLQSRQKGTMATLRSLD
ncbi:uncharacterized protein PHALS_00348 [Plasmopara halstedii]|uniref:Uncharacterized protein n=1 Tax=Plasmopara halstedii TaxID=4781 RepID=A0A0P1A769_PLAHL|nr:uncharacterized protein PHALS_00348 [Plasmopara halstedii]CEG36026.1 hypothetical protein PHALS_00348 [Plasmopara halstedii]|eukprot:XP_024572395.1 hypothetical protein PHALS_00348 [Plasmopara halstedii]